MKGELGVRPGRFVVLGVALAAMAAMIITPAARGDLLFLECKMRVAMPYIYSGDDGAQFVGSRVDATDCATNASDATLTLMAEVNVGIAGPDGNAVARIVHYTGVHHVLDGENWSMSFPGDGEEAIPLLPGNYLASSDVKSNFPGYHYPDTVPNVELFSWHVNRFGPIPG